MKLLAPSLFAAAMAASFGAAAADPAKVTDGMITGPSGMTLYTFDADGTGKPTCNGACAANWPPLVASDSDQPSGDWTVVQRDDGKKQWSYKGKPLYYWSKDSKPGDKTGDGVNKVWHLAKP